MVSDIIRKQVEGIQKQNHIMLTLFSVIILLSSITLFLFFWFVDVWIVGLYWIGASRIIVQGASLMELNYYIVKLAGSLVFFVAIVWYFWWIQNKRQSHILFIGDKEEQINKKCFSTLFLILIGTISLSSVIFYQQLCGINWWNPNSWWSFEHPFWQAFFHTYRPIGIPALAASCTIIFLCAIYYIKPVLIKENLILLFLIPIILSFCAVFSQTNYLLFDPNTGWLAYVLRGIPPGSGSIAFARNVMFIIERTLILTSFILLFYLTLHINAEYANFYTFADGKLLPNFIDEGVGILPTRGHIGDSYIIPLDLKLNDVFVKSGDYLEAELQAAGIEVKDKNQLRVNAASPVPVTAWNCRFAESGTHTLNLMIHAAKPNSSMGDLIFMQTQDVKVSSFLSASLVPILALVVPILAAVVQALIAFFLKGGTS